MRPNDEDALRRRVNGNRLKRRAKKHSLVDLLAFVQPSSHSQTTTSLLVDTHGFSQHCRHLARGCAFHRLLRRGYGSWKNSAAARRVPIPLAHLRSLHRSAWPKSSARFTGRARFTPDGFAHAYRAANFCGPTGFRQTSAAARDCFLSFAVRSEVRAVCADVQREAPGSAPGAGLL